MRFKIKYLAILPCLGFLIFSGCQKTMSNELSIEKNLENEVVITENDKRYDAHVTYMPEGVASISFKSPESLVGMTFEYKNGKYIVSNKELSGEYNLNPLEKNSAFSKIMGIFNSLSNDENLKFDSKDDEKFVFKVNFEDSEYKITTNKEGKVLLIENPSENFKVEFVG